MARILLAEDDATFALAVRKLLEGSGHSVDVTADGRSAFSMLCAEDFSLVITDLIMPEQDGLGILLEVKKLKPEIPVIVMTGYVFQPKRESSARPSYLDVAHRLGADEILHKPFTPVELRDAVDRCLGKRQT